MRYRNKVFSDKYMEVYGVLAMTPTEGVKKLTEITKFVPVEGWQQKVNGKTFEQTFKPKFLYTDGVNCGKVYDCPFCRLVFGEENSKHLEKEISTASHGLCKYQHQFHNSLRSPEDYGNCISGKLKEIIILKYDKDVLGLEAPNPVEFAEYLSSLTDGKCFLNVYSDTDCVEDTAQDHIRSQHHGFSLREGNGLLLASTKNSSKNNKFPSDFYSYEQLKDISERTGTSIEDLQQKIFNEDMFEYFKRHPNKIIEICNTRSDPDEAIDAVNEWFGKYEVHRKENQTLYKSEFEHFKKFTLVEEEPIATLVSHLEVA